MKPPMPAATGMGAEYGGAYFSRETFQKLGQDEGW